MQTHTSIHTSRDDRRRLLSALLSPCCAVALLALGLLTLAGCEKDSLGDDPPLLSHDLPADSTAADSTFVITLQADSVWSGTFDVIY